MPCLRITQEEDQEEQECRYRIPEPGRISCVSGREKTPSVSRYCKPKVFSREKELVCQEGSLQERI